MYSELSVLVFCDTGNIQCMFDHTLFKWSPNYKTNELFQNVNHMPVAYNTFIVQSTLS